MVVSLHGAKEEQMERYEIIIALLRRCLLFDLFVTAVVCTDNNKETDNLEKLLFFISLV